MPENHTQYEKGCAGVNRVSDVKKNANGTHEVIIGVFGTTSINGDFVERIEPSVFEEYRARVTSPKGVLIERTSVNMAIPRVTVFEIDHRHVCASMIDVKMEDNAEGVQVMYGTILPIGPGAEELTAFLNERENGVLVFGHRTLCEKVRKGSRVVKEILNHAIIAMFDITPPAVSSDPFWNRTI